MVRLRLHVLLAEKELNQKQIANMTGIGKNTISRYCSNTWQKINRKDIDLLCDVLNCKIEELIICEKESDV